MNVWIGVVQRGDVKKPATLCCSQSLAPSTWRLLYRSVRNSAIVDVEMQCDDGSRKNKQFKLNYFYLNGFVVPYVVVLSP